MIYNSYKATVTIVAAAQNKGGNRVSVRKNSKGLWDADLYYKDFSGKLIKKRKINFKSKKEAQN